MVTDNLDGRRHRLRSLAALAALCMLAACGKPVPKEKAAYVGVWTGPNMMVAITPEGNVSYKRVKGTTTTSVNGPLQEFQGDSFTVGVLFMKTSFDVSKPPYEQGGEWRMVVDGVELSRGR